MAQHRSVTQRLQRAKSSEAKRATLQEWANSWQSEQMQLIRELGKAIADNNYDQECIKLGELKAASIKKFDALPRVLNYLIDKNNEN